MKAPRILLGVLGALVCVLPVAPLARWLTEGGLSVGFLGLPGFLLAYLGCCLGSGRSWWLAYALGLLLPLPVTLPGVYYGYAELIFEENRRFGCSMEEALELAPIVMRDPINRNQLIWDLGWLLLLALIAALLTAKYRQLRRRDQQAAGN